MRFSDYIDRVYVTKTVEVQQEFSLFKQAETRAMQDLIDWQRSFYKLLSYFKVLAHYLYCNITKNYPEKPDVRKILEDMKSKEKSELTLVKSEGQDVQANPLPN